MTNLWRRMIQNVSSIIIYRYVFFCILLLNNIDVAWISTYILMEKLLSSEINTFGTHVWDWYSDKALLVNALNAYKLQVDTLFTAFLYETADKRKISLLLVREFNENRRTPILCGLDMYTFKDLIVSIYSRPILSSPVGQSLRILVNYVYWILIASENFSNSWRGSSISWWPVTTAV